MPIFRRTIRNAARERARRIDRVFERLLQVIIVANVFFIIATWSSEREALRLTAVEVRGALAVDASAALARTRSLLDEPLLVRIARDNIVLYPKRAIESAIKRLDSRVKEVDVALLPHRRLVATVVEYVPAYLWCSPEDDMYATSSTAADCYFADETGHIFSRAPDYSGLPFLVFSTTHPAVDPDQLFTHQAILPSDEFATVKIFLDELRRAGLDPRLLRQMGEHDFLVATQMPWTVRFTSAADPRTTVEHLTLALEHLSDEEKAGGDVGVIDLRFGNKVFYR